jgi:hypothetical protein
VSIQNDQSARPWQEAALACEKAPFASMKDQCDYAIFLGQPNLGHELRKPF